MQLERLDNWKTNLTAHINKERETPFEWGKHDCALWAADCINAMTGVDLAKDIRGTYNTPVGAFKGILKYYKCDNIKQVFATQVGEEIHIALARPGDIVFRNSNYEGFNAAVGVCYGAMSFFVTDDYGLEVIETLSLDGGFRVG